VQVRSTRAHRNTDAAGREAPVPPAADTRAPIDEREAFALVCRHMRTISRRRDAELEDLVQIAARRVFGHLARFEARSTLSTWIFRICYRTYLNERRWHRRWLRSFTLTATGELPEPASFEEPLANLERQERSARLGRALDAISPKLSTVVILHDVKGVAIEEICELLGLKPHTARSRLRNGRRELTRRLHGDPYFGDRAGAQKGRSDLDDV
jgi:RNA polymerase sigma-70 factor (ECF subfamily)